MIHYSGYLYYNKIKKDGKSKYCSKKRKYKTFRCRSAFLTNYGFMVVACSHFSALRAGFGIERIKLSK